MKHLGDITKLKGSEVPLTEIVVGGSPCQDLSVAGKRAGLAGARSGLFMEQIRLIKEMRENDRKNGRTDEHIRPRYMVWENVPGAFSSNKGEDFRAVLEETAKVAEGDACIPRLEKWPHAGCIMGDGWSIAWRLHDAQFWGVPQRRKRIALVADFGGATAPEILFERKGLSRDTSESGETGEGAATDVRSGIEETGRAISFQERAGKPGGGKGILIQNEHVGCLSTLNNQSVCAFEPRAASRVGGHVYEDDVAGTVRANAGDNQQAVVTVEQQIEDFVSGVNAEAKHQQDLIQSDLGVARTLASGTHASGSHLTKTLVTSSINARDNQQAVVYGIGSYDSNAMKSDNPHSGIYEADTSRTLDLNGGSPACNQGGMAVVQGADVYNGELTGDVAATLTEACGGTNTSGAKVVCIEGNGSRPSHRGDGYSESETMYTLNSTEHHAVAVENHPADSRVKVSDDGMVQTLSSRMGTGGGNVPMVMEEPYNATTGSFMRAGNSGIAETLAARDYKDPQIVCNSVVRRLTPLECERLQGYPDGWTDIGEWYDSKGKKHKGDSDSPRYKALGNSIALPFWEWMAMRMVRFLKNENPTMASLFDGISGFCLAFARAGVRPVFSSEIEEYPIAVAKKHFGDDDTGEVGDYEQYL